MRKLLIFLFIYFNFWWANYSLEEKFKQKKSIKNAKEASVRLMQVNSFCCSFWTIMPPNILWSFPIKFFCIFSLLPNTQISLLPSKHFVRFSSIYSIFAFTHDCMFLFCMWQCSLNCVHYWDLDFFEYLTLSWHRFIYYHALWDTEGFFNKKHINSNCKSKKELRS